VSSKTDLRCKPLSTCDQFPAELQWLRAHPTSQCLSFFFPPTNPVKTRCTSNELNPLYASGVVSLCAQLCAPFSQATVSRAYAVLGAQEHMAHLISESSFNFPTHLGLWDTVYCALVLLCLITQFHWGFQISEPVLSSPYCIN